MRWGEVSQSRPQQTMVLVVARDQADQFRGKWWDSSKTSQVQLCLSFFAHFCHLFGCRQLQLLLEGLRGGTWGPIAKCPGCRLSVHTHYCKYHPIGCLLLFASLYIRPPSYTSSHLTATLCWQQERHKERHTHTPTPTHTYTHIHYHLFGNFYIIIYILLSTLYDYLKLYNKKLPLPE